MLLENPEIFENNAFSVEYSEATVRDIDNYESLCVGKLRPCAFQHTKIRGRTMHFLSSKVRRLVTLTNFVQENAVNSGEMFRKFQNLDIFKRIFWSNRERY